MNEAQPRTARSNGSAPQSGGRRDQQSEEQGQAGKPKLGRSSDERVVHLGPVGAKGVRDEIDTRRVEHQVVRDVGKAPGANPEDGMAGEGLLGGAPRVRSAGPSARPGGLVRLEDRRHP